MKTLKLWIVFSLFVKLIYGQSWLPVDTGTNFNVESQIVFNGELFCGGSNTTYTVDCVAKWNGTNWSNVGSGLIYDYQTEVRCFAVYNGELYAGGNISGAIGSATNVAKWNGQNWTPVGTFMDSYVQTLAVYNGNLYAGGAFTIADGITVNHIAKWNGINWDSVGPGTNSTVLSLASYNNELIVGGIFGFAGGVSRPGLAKWNGISWNSVTYFNGSVESLIVDGNDLYIGGSFNILGTPPIKNIGKWNGINFSSLGLGIHGWVKSMAFQNGELYVGGHFDSAGIVATRNIARWDRTNWHSLGAGTNNEVWSLATFNNEMFAGGVFDSVNNVAIKSISKWNVPCSAFFDVYPEIAPHTWTIINYSTGGASLSYVWQWGDGDSSVGATPTHIYSVPGLYNICLTISDSNGCNSTFCDSSTYFTKLSSNSTMIFVSVRNQVNGVNEFQLADVVLDVFPNPSLEKVFIKSDQEVQKFDLFDMTGRIIMRRKINSDKFEIDLYNILPGTYLLVSHLKEGEVHKILIKE